MTRSLLHVYVKLFLTAVFWGGTFVAGRIVAASLGPFSAAFLRFGLASLFLCLFLLSNSHTGGWLPRGRQWMPIVGMAVSGIAAYNIFFFSGLRSVEAGRASLIIAANPAFIAMGSAHLFGEKLDRLRRMGILLSISGAVVVISRGHLSMVVHGDVSKGDFLIFGCVVCWTTYSLLGKVVLQTIDPLVAVTHASILGTLILGVPAIQEGLVGEVWQVPAAVWAGLAYLGFFGTSLGFLWYYQGIRAIGPSRSGVFINVVPLSAVLMAWSFLGEAIDSSIVTGAFLVSVGVYLTNRD